MDLHVPAAAAFTTQCPNDTMYGLQQGQPPNLEGRKHVVCGVPTASHNSPRMEDLAAPSGLSWAAYLLGVKRVSHLYSAWLLSYSLRVLQGPGTCASIIGSVSRQPTPATWREDP